MWAYMRRMPVNSTNNARKSIKSYLKYNNKRNGMTVCMHKFESIFETC